MSAETSPKNANTQEPWTVRRILEWTTPHLEKHGSETPRLDGEILLAHARGCARIELYTRYDERLSDAERATMRDLVRRRAEAVPVAYLVGFREFFSLEFRVTADVLIPRPETETLVVELLTIVEEQSQPRVADIGTGSGCIAVSAAANNTRMKMTAIDISEAALNIAVDNAERHQVSDRIDFLQGDLFSPLAAADRFDVIVSNPPYIREEEMATLQSDVRLHEPHLALVAGDDGLSIIRRLVEGAPNYLAEGGSILMEFSPEQADNVSRLFDADGRYSQTRVIKDLAGEARVVHARLQSRPSTASG